MVKNRLSEAEEMIMSVIWESEKDLRAYDITNLVKRKFGKEWQPQTVMTFLQRLNRKGFIGIYKDKKEYKRDYSFYHAEVIKEDYLLVKLQDIQEMLFDGSKEEMKKFIENMKEQ